MRSRSGTHIVVGASALVLGVVVGVAASRLADEPRDEAAQGAGIVAEGELPAVPRGPLSVRAERVVLPAGFVSRHRHGGPTFNFVDAGTVVIESDGREQRYGQGGFFFEPAGRVHTVAVLDDARLWVIRLLPPGVEATVDVP